MTRPVAQAYLDTLWTLLNRLPFNLELVSSLENRIEEDPQLSAVERAMLLEMIKAFDVLEMSREEDHGGKKEAQAGLKPRHHLDWGE